MVERGQPWRCITDGCTRGTVDDSRRCLACRKEMRALNEDIFARELDPVTCSRCKRVFRDATTKQHHLCPPIYEHVFGRR